MSTAVSEITWGIINSNNTDGFADFQLAMKTVATTKQRRLN